MFIREKQEDMIMRDNYFMENDNSVHKSRQREGIAETRQSGSRFGRYPKSMQDNFFRSITDGCLRKSWLQRRRRCVKSIGGCFIRK